MTREPDAELTPAEFAEHEARWRELAELLNVAGASPTYDGAASIALPCLLCGTQTAERQLYVMTLYGQNYRRPLCTACARPLRLKATPALTCDTCRQIRALADDWFRAALSAAGRGDRATSVVVGAMVVQVFQVLKVLPVAP